MPCVAVMAATMVSAMLDLRVGGTLPRGRAPLALSKKKKLGPRLFCRTYVVLAPAPFWHGAHPHEKPLKRPHAWHCPGAPLDPLRAVGAVQEGAAVGAEVVAGPYADHHMSTHGHLFILPAAIHQTLGIRLILLIPAGTAPAAAAIRPMRACARVSTCLPGSQTRTVATTPRAGGTKICTNYVQTPCVCIY